MQRNSEALSDPVASDDPCGPGAPEYEMVVVPASASNEGSPPLECAGDVANPTLH